MKRGKRKREQSPPKEVEKVPTEKRQREREQCPQKKEAESVPKKRSKGRECAKGVQSDTNILKDAFHTH
jgi:hypothetical protein